MLYPGPPATLRGIGLSPRKRPLVESEGLSFYALHPAIVPHSALTGPAVKPNDKGSRTSDTAFGRVNLGRDATAQQPNRLELRLFGGIIGVTLSHLVAFVQQFSLFKIVQGVIHCHLRGLKLAA
jgi:hypothetical protein